MTLFGSMIAMAELNSRFFVMKLLSKLKIPEGNIEAGSKDLAVFNKRSLIHKTCIVIVFN
jgi:hypothetical protein